MATIGHVLVAEIPLLLLLRVVGRAVADPMSSNSTVYVCVRTWAKPSPSQVPSVNTPVIEPLLTMI